MATTKSARKTKKTYDGPSPEEILVADLIAVMEQGKTPWRRQWQGANSKHLNVFSGHHYSGSNIFLLELGMALRNAALPYWCGAAEAKAHGLFPKKGSKSVRILRPQLNKREEENAEGETIEKMWTSFKVVPIFNVCDLDGEGKDALIEDAKIKHGYDAPVANEHSRIEAAEQCLEAWPVEVVHGGSRACYSPSADRIALPEFQNFDSAESYYATRAHECIHSTGHKERLARDLTGSFGSKKYAQEELIAELGSVLLCNQLQISSDFTNHAAYLQSWIEVLKEEPKILFRSLSAANKAAQLVLNWREQQVSTESTAEIEAEEQELCLAA